MTNTQRSRSWDPSTIALSEKAEVLVTQATEDQFQARQGRLASIGIKARRNRGDAQSKETYTVGAIVLDALAHHLSIASAPLVIPLDKNWLSSGPDDVIARNRTVNDRLYDLEAAGWVKTERIRLNGTFVTTLAVGPKAIDASRRLGVSLQNIGTEEVSPNLVLKGIKPTTGGGHRPTLQFKPTPLTERIRQKLLHLNKLLASANIQSSVVHGREVDTRRRRNDRLFLDGDFQRGGRLGGPAFWYQLSKAERRTLLRLDGDHIAEVDLQAAMPSIAYGLQGKTPVGDPYTLSVAKDIPREAIKLALMQMLWRPVTTMTRLSKEARSLVPNHYRARDLFELITERNGPIAHLLGAPDPCGAELMWHESEIIIDATLACFDAGFTALPLHDALLVACGPAMRANELLGEAFENHLGVQPTIKVELFHKLSGEMTDHE